MTGKIKHLIRQAQLIDRTDRIPATYRIEIHKNIIEHYRQRLGMLTKLLNEAEPQSKIELFGRTPT